MPKQSDLFGQPSKPDTPKRKEASRPKRAGNGCATCGRPAEGLMVRFKGDLHHFACVAEKTTRKGSPR